MGGSGEKVLLVESDADISDLIVRQTLQPMGYHVRHVKAATTAIQEVLRFAPDVILANLDLPDLSGKDLLVALSSQGIDVPVIVLAKPGSEMDIIQAFRLGAFDYLQLPVREAEVVSALERVFKQLRAQQEREQLALELHKTNQELQQRLKELTTIFAIGKAVTSITEQRILFDKVVEGAVQVSEADVGWLLLRKEESKTFILSAYLNLPQSVGAKLNQTWDDGISTLVALSGETLEIHGEPLKRFRVSQLGRAALVVPIKAKNEVIGLLVVMRKALRPFSSNEQALLEAVADYAAISLVNASLFRALEERIRRQQKGDVAFQSEQGQREEKASRHSHQLRSHLMVAMGYIGMLMDGQLGALDDEQRDALRICKQKLQAVIDLLDRS